MERQFETSALKTPFHGPRLHDRTPGPAGCRATAGRVPQRELTPGCGVSACSRHHVGGEDGGERMLGGADVGGSRPTMSRTGGGGAGLLLCGLTHCVLGGLLALGNVSLTSKNFSLLLTWVPEERSPEILYLTKIKPSDVWLSFPNCTNLSGEGCDVTCTIEDCYRNYQAKVGRIVPGHPTAWSLSRQFYPFFDLELGAPQLQVVLKEKSVLVLLKIKLAACKEKVLKACLIDNLSYEVEFWNADERVKRPIKQSSTENKIEIKKDRLRGSNNCVSARSVYKSTMKQSNFSEPVCFNLKAKGHQTAMIFAILVSLLGMFILIPIIVVKVKKKTSGLKIPEALDFTKNITFTQMEDYQPVECSLLYVIHCNKNEEMNEEKTVLERNIRQENIKTSVLGDLDCSSESDEENECSDYTENHWIPDGMIFDEDETLDDDFHQTSNTEPYQKANCSFTSSHIAIDIQSQDSDCSSHQALQTKLYAGDASSSSVTSVVLNSQNYSDSIGLLEDGDNSNNGDIPLTSVKLLICNGEYDDGTDLLPYNPSVLDHDLNFQDNVAFELVSNPTCLCEV
ncbi:uncharacterized protein LOC127581882 [Pristis pectinata]|uniref:uncharacterized protein LOC127581882 n=1 Tax=Pristis pectinata TaxID=685728 RepID=UPI00223DA2AE|nr:uncharacterized protein LOC127581882 [Pristis pectinata]